LGVSWCTAHELCEEKVWGNNYCDWGNIFPGAHCYWYHDWNCTHTPSMFKCFEIDMHVFAVGSEHLFEIVCRYNDQEHILCPLREWSESSPCQIEHRFETLPDVYDHTIRCSMRAPKSVCLSWKEMAYDNCEDHHVLTPHGIVDKHRGLSRVLPNEQIIAYRRHKRQFVDWDDPFLQAHIDQHPQHFAHFRPHNGHPRTLCDSSVLKQKTRSVHIQPLSSFVHERFTDHVRTAQALAITTGVEYSMINSEHEVVDPDDDEWTRHMDRIEPVQVHETEHFMTFYPDKEPRIERIIMEEEPYTETHTHYFPPHPITSHFVHGRHDPDLQHIHTYHAEHFVPTYDLDRDKHVYVPNHLPLSDRNINHMDNQALHPDDFQGRLLDQAELERARQAKIEDLFYRGSRE